MLNNLRIELRGQADSRFIDDVLEEAHRSLTDSRDRLLEDIYSIVAKNRMENGDADDFFQVVADVAAYGDLAAYQKNVDLTRDRDAFFRLADNALEYAVAVFAIEDRDLSDSLPTDRYNNYRELENSYRKDVLPTLRDAGRSTRRDDRGGRDTRNDRSRDVRDNRSRDTGYTSYGNGNRDIRDTRSRDDYTQRSTPRRTDDRDGTVMTAYGAGIPQQRPAEPTQRRNEPYAGGDQLSNSDRPRSRERHAPAPETFYGSTYPMENYEAHELRALQTPTRDSNAIIIPMVDFTRTPEIAVKEVVESSPEIKELTDVVNYVTECEFPLAIGITDKLIGKQDLTMYRGVQYRLRNMPLVLMSAFEGFESYKSFVSWYNALQKAMQIIHQLPEDQLDYQAVAVSFVQQVNADMTRLFNMLLSIIDDEGASVVSFVDHADAAFTWLQSPDGADINRLYMELEPEFMRHNYAVLTDAEVEKVNEAGKIIGPVGATNDIKHCWITTRVLTVHYRDSLLGKSLQLTAGKVCNVDFKATPDFYNACARIVRLRNTRMNMGMILLTDTLGHQIQVLAGKRDGGQIRVKSFNP